MSAMHHQPSGAAYDVVLLLHVACVLAGLATTVTAAATASRLRKLLDGGAPVPEALHRYFQPGVNWAGRAIYGIPVFGFALLAMSNGAYALGDGWVLSGLVLFVAAAGICEAVLWPAERRVQAAVGELGAHAGDTPPAIPATGAATVMTRSALAALVLLLAGTVVMVIQP
jgi:uncharacterized membrane protein